MQRRIFLHQSDPNPTDKKLNAKELFSATKLVRDIAISSFRKQLKSSLFAKSIAIITEEELYPQVVIEYSDKIQQEVYEWLITIDVVETIDNYI